LPKDKPNVKEENLSIVKLLKKNVFGRMVLSVHFVEKERQQEDALKCKYKNNKILYYFSHDYNVWLSFITMTCVKYKFNIQNMEHCFHHE